MKNMPLTAKLFIGIIIAAGAGTLAYVSVSAHGSPQELAVFMVLGALAGSQNIRLVRSANTNATGKMSVAFAVTYAAMLRFGPAGAALVGLVSGVSACVFPRRKPLYQSAFNLANITVTAYVSGLVYKWLGGSFGHIELQDCILPVATSTMAYYVLNTMSVSAAIGLTSRSSILRVWHDNFLWTAPGFFAGSSCAVIAHGLYSHLNSNMMLVALSLPILYLTYYSYKIYVEKAEQTQRHVEELQMGKDQLASLYLATIESLATAIDAKDTYTREHISRVQDVAVRIAQQMGVKGSELEGLRTASLLHDIGKLGVPEHILLKPGKLTPDEYAKIQRHAAIGAKILDPVQFPWPVTSIVRCHHEKFDGSGYPDGLKGQQIPLLARILAVADVYDALTSQRSYREGWSHAQAVEHVMGLAGTHFDPDVTDAFATIASELEPLAESSQVSQSESQCGQNKPSPSPSHDRGAAEDIARANHELMALFEVAQTLSSTLNLEEALILLVNKIKNVVQASTCAILLCDAEDPTLLTAPIAAGVNQDHFQGATTKSGEGRTGQALATGEAWQGEYDMADLVLSSSYANWIPLKSALSVPLPTETGVIGVMNLYHVDANAFTQEDMVVLNVVAKQAAVAIQKAQLFESARESALRDPLTGLHNARYLFTTLEQELSRAIRTNRPLSVLGIDLDNFKLINDNFGHERGDAVLSEVADIFRAQVREYDLVVRYAGDEFIVVLPDTGSEDAAKTADRIRQAVADYAQQLPSSSLAPLGVSIGLASAPEDASDLKTLLAKADAAMYEDKRARKKWSLAA